MSLTPSKVTWDPNRYKATEYVITYDSNGTPTLSKKEADYTGVNYNFSSLPSGTTTQTTTDTTTQQTGTTTQAQTTEAFGDVKPYYWNQGGDNEGNQNQEIIKTSSKQQPQLSGFFNPLDKAISGEPVGSLGMRVKQKFEDITGKTERDWEDVDRDIEIDRVNAELAKGGLDYEEEATLRNELSELQKQSTTGFFTKPKDLAKKTYEKTGLKKAVDFLKPFPLKIADAMVSPVQKSRNSFNKNYFSQENGIYENGKIAGNPSKSVFAGMNSQSMFGNPAKSAAKRIAKRNKTIATKNVSKEFIQNTKNMERELDNYNRDHNDHNISEYNRDKAKTQGTVQQLNPHEMRNVAETGDAGGDSGGKIVCTMMNESYGFGSFRNKIWMKFHKDLSLEYQRGYHRLFLPLVKIAKTNKIIKNILEHIAVHSTIDMRQSMRGKKHLLGRVYRKILLPICYWVGKI
tara:strand:+ start:344 stop:1720 length:1377 start_codon:yes stop_codon:yes gene_type:complete